MKSEKLKWKYKSTKNDERHEDAFVHIKMLDFGYDTLCGLGSEGVQNGYRKNPNYLERTSKKVNCEHCLKIYNFCNSIKL